MPSRTSQRNASTRQKTSTPAPAPQRPKQVYEIVHPLWLAKMFLAMIVLALLCAQLLVCYVFYKTQWQYVLKPSRELALTPSSQGMSFTPVRFGVDATGEPQLDGWWIPATTSSANTALMLHSGDGSMGDAVPSAKALHDAGLNVLIFDYRGYGHSGGRHPTQQLMQTDAESALNYLTSTRGIAPRQIIVFGTGVGASIATQLCHDHSELPTLVLWNAEGDMRDRVEQDRRVRIVPIGLLFNQDFPLVAPLAALSTPKLLLTTNASHAPAAFANAHDPKTTVELNAGDNAAMQAALRRFLDQNLATPIPTLGK
jgi:pimeloyl-ACP methyl ester carboxylesterase